VKVRIAKRRKKIKEKSVKCALLSSFFILNLLSTGCGLYFFKKSKVVKEWVQ
jgi:hypothetical protein